MYERGGGKKKRKKGKRSPSRDICLNGGGGGREQLTTRRDMGVTNSKKNDPQKDKEFVSFFLERDGIF